MSALEEVEMSHSQSEEPLRRTKFELWWASVRKEWYETWYGISEFIANEAWLINQKPPLTRLLTWLLTLLMISQSALS